MSVQSEITRITGNIASAYTAVSGKGGTLPSAKNSANLPAAIQSIPTSDNFGVTAFEDGVYLYTGLTLAQSGHTLTIGG